jgi:CheY-like chemotaxis protein
MAGTETVLVLTSNLFFMPRIEAAAGNAGMETVQVSSGKALIEAAKGREAPLVLVDLEMDETVWTEGLAAINRLLKTADGPLVVAYGPHGEPGTLRKARELGSDAVLIKRDFSERLPELLETRGRAAIS